MALTKIDSDKKICGIIGNPLGHTLSPVMHNTAFQELDLNYEYYVFEIEEHELANTLNDLKARGVRGLNVTYPYKSKVMQYLDNLDELAQEIGAVNTIVNTDGILIGYNTDAFGARESLRSNSVALEGCNGKILIIGAGGGARAAAFSLAKTDLEIVIANRTYEKGEELAKALNKITRATAVKLDEISEVISDVAILINCTPMGMKGYLDESTIPVQLLRNDMVVFDIVYSPKYTPLLIAAKNVGATVIYGYEMLVHQGAKAFELWTGKNAPIDVMRKVVLDELGRD